MRDKKAEKGEKGGIIRELLFVAVRQGGESPKYRLFVTECHGDMGEEVLLKEESLIPVNNWNEIKEVALSIFGNPYATLLKSLLTTFDSNDLISFGHKNGEYLSPKLHIPEVELELDVLIYTGEISPRGVKSKPNQEKASTEENKQKIIQFVKVDISRSGESPKYEFYVVQHPNNSKEVLPTRIPVNRPEEIIEAAQSIFGNPYATLLYSALEQFLCRVAINPHWGERSLITQRIKITTRPYRDGQFAVMIGDRGEIVPKEPGKVAQLLKKIGNSFFRREGD